MKSLLDIPEMARSSRGWNLYLLAKMVQFMGKTQDAIEYFGKCKDETPLMYQHLMSQDADYDLVKLRDWLKQNLKGN